MENTATHHLIPGDTVRITHRLGLVSNPNGERFVDPVAEVDTLAVFRGPHPNPALGPEWFMLGVIVDGEELYAPAHSGHFLPTDNTRGAIAERLQAGAFDRTIARLDREAV